MNAKEKIQVFLLSAHIRALEENPQNLDSAKWLEDFSASKDAGEVIEIYHKINLLPQTKNTFVSILGFAITEEDRRKESEVEPS